VIARIEFGYNCKPFILNRKETPYFYRKYYGLSHFLCLRVNFAALPLEELGRYTFLLSIGRRIKKLFLPDGTKHLFEIAEKSLLKQ
jgi:hypothetical protein